MVRVLEVPRSEVVIRVRMADDHVLDLLRIEPDLLHSLFDILDHVVVRGIVKDDSFRCRDRPHRLQLRPDIIEIVEHLDRLAVIPLRTRRNLRIR